MSDLAHNQQFISPYDNSALTRYVIELKHNYINLQESYQILKDTVDTLHDTMTIDYGKQLSLNRAASVRLVSILGGKEAKAYLRIGRRAFKSFWRDYQARFRVNTYRNTPASKYEDALEWIACWEPDDDLYHAVEALNDGKEETYVKTLYNS